MLSALFDGEVHYLTPGEEFSGMALDTLQGFEFDDEEVTGWETPARYADILTGSVDPWLQENIQGWACFAIEARRLSTCLGKELAAYQHNLLDAAGADAGTKFTMQTKASERGWEGLRL